MYIKREIDCLLSAKFDSPLKQGLILAGIVGCGKSTTVEIFLAEKGPTHTIFRYSGDDINFRERVQDNTRTLAEEIQSIKNPAKPALIFIDEVQKSEAIFDAVKYAFDTVDASFIVTGSNPEYLNTIARSRLQRRADFLTLHPLSMPEILHHRGFLPDLKSPLVDYLFCNKTLDEININADQIADLKILQDRFLHFGGLPRSYLSPDETAMFEIRQTIERGILDFKSDDQNHFDSVLIELGRLHSKEFSYTNIFKKTGTRRRDKVNTVLSSLRDQGYIFAKSPSFINEQRRSYLRVYAWIDPGFVSYLVGAHRHEDEGSKIEGIVHTRLDFWRSVHPYKTELAYYKPYKIDANNAVKFLPGEIDFILTAADRIIPIEVKRSAQISSIDTTLMKHVLTQYKLPVGIVLYGGMPAKRGNILFFPWWYL